MAGLCASVECIIDGFEKLRTKNFHLYTKNLQQNYLSLEKLRRPRKKRVLRKTIFEGEVMMGMNLFHQRNTTDVNI